jgi:hypothetical protein
VERTDTTDSSDTLSPRRLKAWQAALLALAAIGAAALSVGHYGPLLWPPEFEGPPAGSIEATFTRPLTIAPQTAPRAIPADQAEVDDADWFIAVEVHGNHRLYPIWLLEQSLAAHVVNDSLGGVPIAVTWCDLSQTAAVYARESAQGILTFGVGGTEAGELILHCPETAARWSQRTGERTDAGGEHLKKLDHRLITGAEWRELGSSGEIYIGDAQLPAIARAASRPLDDSEGAEGLPEGAAMPPGTPAGLIWMQQRLMRQTGSMGLGIPKTDLKRTSQEPEGQRLSPDGAAGLPD